MRKDLEETLERREIRMRKLVRGGDKVEGVRELGQGRQKLDKEKESGTDMVRKRRVETAKVRDEERPAVGGTWSSEVEVRGGPGRTYSEALREARTPRCPRTQ